MSHRFSISSQLLAEVTVNHWHTQPPLRKPTSPTAAKREPKTPVAVSVSEDNTPPAGGIDSPGIGDDSTEVALLSGNPDRGRGLRSSKRLREDRGGGSKAREQPGSG